MLARLADKLPIQWSAAGIKLGKKVYPADKHALIAIYPNPLNPQRYVVLNSGFTFREYDYLNNARQTPKLPDWAIVDTTASEDARGPDESPAARAARMPGKIVAADFFDERWLLRAQKP